MKKSKELLLFIIPLLLLMITGCVSYCNDIFLFGYVLSSKPQFFGFSHMIRLFFHDKIFINSIFNTYCAGLIPSFIIGLVFALAVFLIRKKIRLSRIAFYLSTVFICSAVSLVSTVYMYIKSFGLPSSAYTAQSLISYELPSFLESIKLTNVLFALQIGVFTAFVFWLAELIYKKRFFKHIGERV